MSDVTENPKTRETLPPAADTGKEARPEPASPEKPELTPSGQKAVQGLSEAGGEPSSGKIKGEETGTEESVKGAEAKGESGEDLYARPTHFREGVRPQVWENAKDKDGKVRDPLTNKVIPKNGDWDMGHKPGYEFRYHQESARIRGISREQFLNEYNDPRHYRPELHSSNCSHKLEKKNFGQYRGD